MRDFQRNWKGIKQPNPIVGSKGITFFSNGIDNYFESEKFPE